MNSRLILKDHEAQEDLSRGFFRIWRWFYVGKTYAKQQQQQQQWSPAGASQETASFQQQIVPETPNGSIGIY
jgi:hypothetical protein